MEQGNFSTMYLNVIYIHSDLTGKGVAKHQAKAMEWFRKAADQRHPHASYNLAVGHLKGFKSNLKPGEAHQLISHAALKGKVMDKHQAKAMEWFRKAADQGHPHASYNLAVGHLKGYKTNLKPGEAHQLISHDALKGKGMDKQQAKAIEWSRKTAERHTNGTFNLAVGHLKGFKSNLKPGEAQQLISHAALKGKVMDKHQAKAMEWFRKAADQGDPHEHYNLAVGHLKGFKTNLKPGEAHQLISHDALKGKGMDKQQAKAIEWSSKTAERHTNGTFDLAVGHLKGFKSNLKPGEAHQLISHAALKGKVMDKHQAKAMEWFRKAADQGDPHEHYNLAVGHLKGFKTNLKPGEAHQLISHDALKGKVMDKHQAKAMEWFRKAADQRHPHASYTLAVGHVKGYKTNLKPGEAHQLISHTALKEKGMAKHQAKAMEWFRYFRKAADQGHPHVPYNLAVGHLKGFKTNLKPGEAHQLISHAASKGEKEVHQVLSEICKRGGCQ
ncbi:secretory immunoglobulin A-binding protein EsiB-like [Pecten maximus]|uniref:secretory immunoglobulin A-binding protein EsiB-like n=1 Tax=Pecten maximus TaxID=6579 RepID=UPI0014589CBB|nr:secretory immunoglobulin A-binding protein EsiB-like [Pecten maximus]